MKTNQTSPKGSAARATKQVTSKTASSPASKPTAGQSARPVSLCLLDATPDNLETITGLDYSAAEFAEIQRVADANGESLSNFLESAIKAKLTARTATGPSAPVITDAPGLFGELENAIDQSEALLILFIESHSGSEHGGWNDNIKNGFVHLCITTNDRLRRANSSIENALKGGVR